MRKYLCISEGCRIFASEKETKNKLNPKTRKGREIMKTFAQYSKEVLTVVISKYGFEREAALTIITGTILMLNKANLL